MGGLTEGWTGREDRGTNGQLNGLTCHKRYVITNMPSRGPTSVSIQLAGVGPQPHSSYDIYVMTC